MIDREFERCGNCGWTHFSHIVKPDHNGVVVNLCPHGIGMPESGTYFRAATKQELARWGKKT